MKVWFCNFIAKILKLYLLITFILEDLLWNNLNVFISSYRLTQLANYEQDSKIQFVIDAVYAFAYALDDLKSTVCPTWKGVCPAMSSYDGGEFYKNYLLKVDFKGKLICQDIFWMISYDTYTFAFNHV